jgi:8-oxo-dGTP pyrophosphatase MutT (NUDIX family)
VPISDYLRNLRAKIGHDMVFMPGIAAVVLDRDGRVLLQRSRDSGLWGIIGGTPDPGEPLAQAVTREIEEETSIHAHVDRLVGVFTEVPTVYPNHDVVQYMAFVFACSVLSGEPRINDDESHAVSFFELTALPDDLMARHRFYIEAALRHTPSASYFSQGLLRS